MEPNMVVSSYLEAELHCIYCIYVAVYNYRNLGGGGGGGGGGNAPPTPPPPPPPPPQMPLPAPVFSTLIAF